MKTKAKSTFLLFLTAIIWGFAFVAQRVGAEFVGAFTFNGINVGCTVIGYIGDFAVNSDDEWVYGERRGVATNGNFFITEQKATVNDGDIVPQGYPFFAGEVTFKKVINISKDVL